MLTVCTLDLVCLLPNTRHSSLCRLSFFLVACGWSCFCFLLDLLQLPACVQFLQDALHQIVAQGCSRRGHATGKAARLRQQRHAGFHQQRRRVQVSNVLVEMELGLDFGRLRCRVVTILWLHRGNSVQCHVPVLHVLAGWSFTWFGHETLEDGRQEDGACDETGTQFSLRPAFPSGRSHHCVTVLEVLGISQQHIGTTHAVHHDGSHDPRLCLEIQFGDIHGTLGRNALCL
mmetsp:Transcript_11871/g.34274  ORF Transcript_11871/g.34274 Transcript_11871/m.34274 type:complete len:231 (+) Transcript_11871:97-789(+)